MTKEEKKECMKKYRETHKEQIKAQNKRYYDTHKDKSKKYYKNNKDKIIEQTKKRYESTKELVLKFNKYRRYFYKKFYRFITLKNYIIIMKLEDESLKRSIMAKLGHGIIDQDEAVMLSGMIFTKDDLKEMNEWLYNVCRCKSNLS